MRQGQRLGFGNIEPAGLPAVRLAPLRKLRDRDALSDEDMVRIQRANLLDPGAPNPSVETLLHAFLPHKYLDHTHATAVLSLADQPDAAERCADLYGPRVGIVPYIMPGFLLAKKAAEVYEAAPAVEGLVLLKHGVFSFGDTAREAYERMIAIVTLAEERLARGRKSVFAAASVPDAWRRCRPRLRRSCAAPARCRIRRRPALYKRFVLDFRGGPEVLNFVNGAELPRYGLAGVATPDHTIRTKNYPLYRAGARGGPARRLRTRRRVTPSRGLSPSTTPISLATTPPPSCQTQELDPAPRVILVPGLGLFGLGRSAKDAAIAADLAESWVATVTDAEAIGRFDSLSEAELFEMEYWSLEQAKLGGAVEKPLAGQIARGHRRGRHDRARDGAGLKAAGAEIALIDRAGAGVEDAAKKLGGIGIACRRDRPGGGARRFRPGRGAVRRRRYRRLECRRRMAGPHRRGRRQILRDSFELNFWAHQSVAQNAVRIMRAQRTGGFCCSTCRGRRSAQAPNAGPYGLPKAATLFLMRQYALEYGGDGIRANAVNADGIRGGLLTPDFIAARAAAYGRDRGRNTCRAICCAAKSRPMTWRRPFCILRWRAARPGHS